MKLRTLEDVSQFFQSILVTLEEEYDFSSQGEGLHLDSLRYLAEKQMQFQGDAYFDQVEKNAVYLYEVYVAMCQGIARFLCEGTPSLKGNQVEPYVLSLRIVPQRFGEYHWEYLRNGCNGCPAHDQHERWKPFFLKRRQLPHSEYMEELEFTLVFYQLRFMLAQRYLFIFLGNPKWAKEAHKLRPPEVARVIERDINFRGDMFSGVWNPFATGRKHSTESTWRELWGEQFDQIVREMR